MSYKSIKMNLKHITCFLLSVLLAYSCFDDNDSNYTIDPSYDAQLYSFTLVGVHDKTIQDSTLRAQDSLRFVALKNTTFAIDQINNQIYNPDSLPYGTNPGTLKATVSYNSTYGIGFIKIRTMVKKSNGVMADTIYYWNTNDSISFAYKPMIFTVAARDTLYQKAYNIDLRIHQIDPDTILWEQQTDLPRYTSKQKVLMHDNKFYYYVIDAGAAYLYTADVYGTPFAWESRAISGLPSNISQADMTLFKGNFLAVTDDGDSYISTDGMSWRQQNNSTVLNSIFGILPGSSASEDMLLVSYQEGGNYRFGTTTDLSEINPVNNISGYVGTIIGNDFPVTGFTSVAGTDRGFNGRQLVIIGGSNKNSEELNSTWLVRKSASGLEVTSATYNDYFKGNGLSSFSYDDKLYTFASDKFYISATWGIRWEEASNKQCLHPDFEASKGQSILIDDENYIWIFGGIHADSQNTPVPLNNVWRGRLNKLIK